MYLHVLIHDAGGTVMKPEPHHRIEIPSETLDHANSETDGGRKRESGLTVSQNEHLPFIGSTSFLVAQDNLHVGFCFGF